LSAFYKKIQLVIKTLVKACFWGVISMRDYIDYERQALISTSCYQLLNKQPLKAGAIEG